jgi:DHA1 family inner membrane transport protein
VKSMDSDTPAVAGDAGRAGDAGARADAGATGGAGATSPDAAAPAVSTGGTGSPEAGARGASVGAETFLAQSAPGRARLCIALLVLLGFSLGCSEFVVIGMETELAADLGVTLEAAGRLVSLFALPYAVMTPALALATGRFRRRQLLVGYSLLFCLGNAIGALAPGYGVLVASRLVMGSVSGALLAVGVTFIPDLVGIRKTSAALSVVYASFSVAMVVATSAGKLVAESAGWRPAMVATTLLAVAVCASLVALMPRGGSTDAPASARRQVRLLTEPCVITGMLVFVFGEGSVYVMYGYVSPYLEQVMGLDAGQASFVLMVYGIVTFASNLLGGWIETRLGVRALVGTFGALAAALLGMFALNGAMPGSAVLLMLVALLMYLASVPCVSLFMSVARRRHPDALTLASSLEPMSFNVGIAFGTAVGGVVVSGPGIAWTTAVGAVLALAAAGMAEATFRLAKRARTRG